LTPQPDAQEGPTSALGAAFLPRPGLGGGGPWNSGSGGRGGGVLRIRAEWRLGELLAALVTRGYKSLPDEITRNQSSKWQQLAKTPREVLERPDSAPEAGVREGDRGVGEASGIMMHRGARARNGTKNRCSTQPIVQHLIRG